MATRSPQGRDRRQGAREGQKTIPISAEAASAQIEAALRLHQPQAETSSS